MYSLEKFSLIITTRCNLRCRLCCEYVPQNRPFPDMTTDEAERILAAIFDVYDHIGTLHLTGGGEPFLHQQLPELISLAGKYRDRFDRLMLFTNSTIEVKPALLEAITLNRKIVVQLSQYGINQECEQSVQRLLAENDVDCKIVKYYGDDLPFGGWVDFGPWEILHKEETELKKVYKTCSVTSVLKGNWRTRDGKVHWCSRSQRGMEMGLIPNNPDDYIDLFDCTSAADKREKFQKIAHLPYLSACNYCSGDAGTADMSKRFSAAEQL